MVRGKRIEDIPESTSAGICDSCSVPFTINVDYGYGKYCDELLCEKKHILISPLPPERQLTECKFYKKKNAKRIFHFKTNRI